MKLTKDHLIEGQIIKKGTDVNIKKLNEDVLLKTQGAIARAFTQMAKERGISMKFGNTKPIPFIITDVSYMAQGVEVNYKDMNGNVGTLEISPTDKVVFHNAEFYGVSYNDLGIGDRWYILSEEPLIEPEQ